MGVGINHRIAAWDIGRGGRFTAANLEAATEQLLHHQAAHRAIDIGHLRLPIPHTNQVAIADRDRAVFSA